MTILFLRYSYQKIFSVFFVINFRTRKIISRNRIENEKKSQEFGFPIFFLLNCSIFWNFHYQKLLTKGGNLCFNKFRNFFWKEQFFYQWSFRKYWKDKSFKKFTLPILIFSINIDLINNSKLSSQKTIHWKMIFLIWVCFSKIKFCQQK